MPAAATTAAPDSAHADYQLGMVNPPRRVKRLREIALKDPSSSVAPIAISPPSSGTGASPPASTAAPRRRGRKPAGPLSKSAREQLRKTNHSVIEKRRREKINEALAALRELVPHDKQEGERKEDKEFKLEVLVRTVEYLRIMVAKVKNLEGAMCQRCGGTLQGSSETAGPSEDDQPPKAPKRKRVVCDEETPVEDLDNKSRHPDVVTPTCSNRSAEPQPPRLPSISSWMSMDPSLRGPSPLVNSHAYQLPSPPHTAPFAPITIASSGFPPRLVLPSPIAPNSPASFIQHRGTSSSYQGNSPLPQRTSSTLGPFNTRDRDVPELPLDAPLRYPAIDHGDMLVHSSAPTFTSMTTQTSTLRPPASSSHTPHILSIVPSETSIEADAQCGSPLSPWSRDDQTAASLLLNISSRPRHSRTESGFGSGSESGSVSGSANGSEILSGSRAMSEGLQERSPRSLLPLQAHHSKAVVGKGIGGGPGARCGGEFLEAQTPSSVLGMGEGSGGSDAPTKTI